MIYNEELLEFSSCSLLRSRLHFALISFALVPRVCIKLQSERNENLEIYDSKSGEMKLEMLRRHSAVVKHFSCISELKSFMRIVQIHAKKYFNSKVVLCQG